MGGSPVTPVYDASAHEPLTDTPWHAEHALAGIAAIVADAERAVGPAFWPNHPLDDDAAKPLPDGLTTIYLGAAGMIWALRRLGSSLPLAELADRALARYRARPDFGEDVPSMLMGETGILLVARIVGGEVADDERLRTRIRENERNPVWELMWGSPGTILVAREAGLEDEASRSAALLADACEEDGLWTQDLYGSQARYLGPVHGFAGNVHALRGHLSDDELRTRIEGPLRRYAVVDGPLVNWLPAVGAPSPSRLQWCHGSPGIVATLGDLLPSDLLLGGAELTWHAGPLAKGPGLCHGTAGNGYALLRAHTVTGDEVWLERARRFAMHALEQVERMRERHERGRFTFHTGDVGAALFARSCVDADSRFPTMDVW